MGIVDVISVPGFVQVTVPDQQRGPNRPTRALNPLCPRGLTAGFIASYFFNLGDPMSGINLTSIVIAFLGAVLLLFLLRLVGGRRR